MSLFAGIGGRERNASVMLCTEEGILGVCEQERVTRVRGAGFNRSGLPDEALDELLFRAGRKRGEITSFALTDPSPEVQAPQSLIDQHCAHACASFLPSPFDSAAIVVCDHASPQVSVWTGHGASVSKVDWPWHGIGFAELYSQCAAAIGFASSGREQRLEALARLQPEVADSSPATRLFELEEDRLRLAPQWRASVEDWAGRGDRRQLAAVAAAIQVRVGELLLEFLAKVRSRLPQANRVCVSGSLFRNSYLNSLVKQSGKFGEVFVPVDPGSAGLSVGAALHASGLARGPITPFLGPSYTSEEIKATIDNCKLTYRWVSESDTVEIAVQALQRGLLVAWFDDAMEWGPRALGARSIVANPFSPYVLDNLNRFLKQRESWRGYALSGIDAAVPLHFVGPSESPFMECDFVPRDRERFRHVLPGPTAAVRVQTVAPKASPRFHALLQAFGEASGVPVLVNTSFNGFQEPIVCSPRDAVRVFFGTGIDLLILGQFVISK